MYILNMNRADMRQLKKELPQISGKKMLARGCFSVVYERDEDSVWKLTCDKANYDLAIKMGSSGHPCYQVVHENIGKVGEIYDQPIYLFAVERLVPVRKDNALAKTICNEYIKRFENLGMFRQVRSRRSENASVAESMSVCPNLPTLLKSAFRELATHIRDTGFSLDMAQISNMMLRSSDGVIVLTDPIFHEDFCDQFTGGDYEGY